MNGWMGKKIGMVAVSAMLGFLGMKHANADVILSWNSTAGFAGTETSLGVGTYGSGVVASGGAITRSGLTGNAGGGSFNSAGFNVASNFLTFSLTTTATGSYDLTDFRSQDRASGTGPRDLGLYYSGNNFAQPIASWSDAAAAGTQQEVAAISSVTLLPGTSYTFEIKPTDGTSNGGGSIGSTGTYRIISPDVSLNGTAVTVAAPEPASLSVLGIAAVGLLSRRFRKI